MSGSEKSSSESGDEIMEDVETESEAGSPESEDDPTPRTFIRDVSIEEGESPLRQERQQSGVIHTTESVRLEKERLRTLETAQREEKKRRQIEALNTVNPPVVLQTRHTTQPIGEIREQSRQFMRPTNKQFEKCKRAFVSSDWLSVAGNRVSETYTTNIKYGNVNKPQITIDSNVWYPVNDFYYRVRCNHKESVKWEDDIILFEVDGVEPIRILYKFTNGEFVLQTKTMFDTEQLHFLLERSNPLEKMRLMLSEKFNPLNNHLYDIAFRNCKQAGMPHPDRVLPFIEVSCIGKQNYDYLKKVAEITVFMKNNSVFLQRIQLKYYNDAIIPTLTSYEKADYPEMREYYLGLIEGEIDKMGWETYNLINKGMQLYKLPETIEKLPPVITNENTIGSSVFCEQDGLIYDIKTLYLDFINKDFVTNKPPQFVNKITRMNPLGKIQTDIFAMLKEKLHTIRNFEFTKLQPSTKVCDYCNTHAIYYKGSQMARFCKDTCTPPS